MSASEPGARRVLVVCLGNHCRSPLAAAALARHGPPGTEARSAGMGVIVKEALANGRLTERNHDPAFAEKRAAKFAFRGPIAPLTQG